MELTWTARRRRPIRDRPQDSQTLCRDLNTEPAEHRGVVNFWAHQYARVL